MKFLPIDKETFRNRIQDNFSSGCLTLVSIIQGVAFGIWVSNINSALDIQNFHVYQAIYPALSLLSIIFVFYYYSWFVSIVYTPPNLRESAIPIILAATEVMPMFFFNRPEYWWLFTGIFYIVSVVAFGNTILTVSENLYSDDFRPVIPVIRIELWSNIALCLTLSTLAVCSWATYPKDYNFAFTLPSHDIPFLIVLIILIIAMTGKSQLWFLQKVYCIAGLK